ncbi:MAG: ABC transporter ATP-binding protein [Bacillota bacterium]
MRKRGRAADEVSAALRAGTADAGGDLFASGPHGDGAYAEPILRTVRLNKAFFMGETIYAVNDVNLAIGAGEFVLITGPSGSGKSTLLSLLGGLDRPISGEVILDGRRYSRLNENGLAALRRQRIGFVFQFFNLIPHLTARENVMLPMRFAGRPAREVGERADELLALVGLADRAGHRPSQLSGGEQQRVAIARALVNKPAVVLADEPTGNLDSKTREGIGEIFERLNRQTGQTFIVVSHDETFNELADHVLHLVDGRVERNEVRSRR